MFEASFEFKEFDKKVSHKRYFKEPHFHQLDDFGAERTEDHEGADHVEEQPLLDGQDREGPRQEGESGVHGLPHPQLLRPFAAQKLFVQKLGSHFRVHQRVVSAGNEVHRKHKRFGGQLPFAVQNDQKPLQQSAVVRLPGSLPKEIAEEEVPEGVGE